jgi:hypothetical protein
VVIIAVNKSILEEEILVAGTKAKAMREIDVKKIIINCLDKRGKSMSTNNNK